jgi:hypothetical protein
MATPATAPAIAPYIAAPSAPAQPKKTATHSADIQALESRLQSLHQGMVTDQYEAGAILTDLRAQFPHGSWGVYLKQLCKRISLSERAAKYYMEAFEELQAVGGDSVVSAAKDVNLNTNKKPVRLALVAAHKENPTSPPDKIANSAKIDIEAKRAEAKQKKKFKNPSIEQLVELRKQFPNVQIERVGGSDMTSFQVWVDVQARNAPKGQRVTVEMSTDQLRTVKGTVNVGANGLSATGVRKFLSAWGVKGGAK